MNWINLIVSGIVSAIIPILVISNISKEKINAKYMFKFAIILFPLAIVNYVFFEGIPRIISNIIVIIIALYFSIFNKNISKSVFYAFVYEIFAFIAEILISLIFVSLLKFDLNNYENFSFSLMIFTICNCLMVYFISKINFINKNIRRLSDRVTKNNKEWVYLIIIVILMIFLLTFNKNDCIIVLRR